MGQLLWEICVGGHYGDIMPEGDVLSIYCRTEDIQKIRIYIDIYGYLMDIYGHTHENIQPKVLHHRLLKCILRSIFLRTQSFRNRS